MCSETAQMYFKIFTDIDRLPQLYKYYHKCHKVSEIYLFSIFICFNPSCINIILIEKPIYLHNSNTL